VKTAMELLSAKKRGTTSLSASHEGLASVEIVK
jgi:hypothetical protein